LGAEEVFRQVQGRHALSFPARLPMLALDRIYVRGLRVDGIERLSGEPWSRLSDHAALAARYDGERFVRVMPLDAASNTGAKTMRAIGPTVTGSYYEDITQLPATRYTDVNVATYAHANETEWVAEIGRDFCDRGMPLEVRRPGRTIARWAAQIVAWHRSSELSRKLEKIPGIGPLAATALVASIADARSFNNGRQVSAWLGLVPRQNSSGGKSTLLGISKRGDVYLRTLLIHGARSAILAARRQGECKNVWLANLLNRRHANIAAVALANKNVRTVWALLAHGRDFKADYMPARAAA
jgi:hypothetical protein